MDSSESSWSPVNNNNNDRLPQRPTRAPQRLSALYQYHNAPEVAPAHGLEYDDTPYPQSDKFPVTTRETPAFDVASTIRYTGKHAYVNDNRPPRIIFGMKVKTFLMVAGVMLLVIVGAAVGGAVGGKNMRESGDVAENMNAVNSPNTTHPTTPPTTPTSTFSAPTPTYTPLTDCPASNGTLYTSAFTQSQSPSPPSGSVGLTFIKYCDVAPPPTARRIAAAFVYSFSDCVELCAGANFWGGNANCTVAVYQPEGKRPGNCWVGSAEEGSDGGVVGWGRERGTDVAVLTR